MKSFTVKNSTITSIAEVFLAIIPNLSSLPRGNHHNQFGVNPPDIFLSIDICLCLYISRNSFIFFTVKGIILYTFEFIILQHF